MSGTQIRGAVKLPVLNLDTAPCATYVLGSHGRINLEYLHSKRQANPVGQSNMIHFLGRTTITPPSTTTSAATNQQPSHQGEARHKMAAGNGSDNGRTATPSDAGYRKQGISEYDDVPGTH